MEHPSGPTKGHGVHEFSYVEKPKPLDGNMAEQNSVSRRCGGPVRATTRMDVHKRHALTPENKTGRSLMQRTLSYRASDDGRLLLGERTIAFRLTPRCERGAAAVGVPAGERYWWNSATTAGRMPLRLAQWVGLVDAGSPCWNRRV
jgi:hypothetical protein